MGERTAADVRLGGLMRAAQAGDGDAYRLLLQEITPRLRGAIRRRGATSGNVEDLVQDVLLSVHAARATYDPERPFLPWLLAIVRYRFADGARRYARSAAREVIIEDLDVTFAAPGANRSEERSEDVERLREAIQSLPAGQRQAIELLKLGERSLKEASAETGTSVGALKVAAHRAMGALRKALSGPGKIHGH
jgi:RNA polymerase sigma-70 factor (ECF subfamily)